MNWSAEQQRLLSAMGYVLFARPGTMAVRKSTVHAVAPMLTENGVLSPVTGSAGPGHDQLLGALRRAAGGRDVAGLIPDIVALRRDPMLKRALWPALRALRRH